MKESKKTMSSDAIFFDMEEETPIEQESVPVPEESINADQTPLTPDLISQNLSLIGRTANGQSHAFLRLELHEKDVTNTAGLAQFSHIRYVDLSDNQIVSIKEVDKLSHLLSLNIQNNLVSSITNLDKKKYLQQLNVAKNRLDSFPITLPHLLFLNLNENKLTEKVTLDDFPELLHLEMRGNKLKTTPVKLQAPKLQRLYLVSFVNQGANLLESFQFGIDLASITVLHARGNKIESLESLDRLVSLTYLNLRYS
jgi:Leucine-rich repeat (LRR) protein